MNRFALENWLPTGYTPTTLKKTHKVLLVLLGVIVLAVAGFKAMQPKEPEYQGRRLSEWIADLYGPSHLKRPSEAVVKEAKEVFLPFIEARLMTMEDLSQASKLKESIWEIQEKTGIGYHSSEPFLVSSSLEALKVIGKDSVPTLRRLSLNSPHHYFGAMWVLSTMDETDELTALASHADPRIRASAAYHLGFQDDNRDLAARTLVQLTQDRERKVAEAALAAIATLQPSADQVVPQIMLLLDSNDYWVRAHAARTLGRFDTNALVALPKLKSLLKDPSGEVQNATLEAIRSIDWQHHLTPAP